MRCAASKLIANSAGFRLNRGRLPSKSAAAWELRMSVLFGCPILFACCCCYCHYYFQLWSRSNSQRSRACSACMCRKMVVRLHINNTSACCRTPVDRAHALLTTTRRLPLSACQASCSNAPSLGVRRAIVGDEAQWLGGILTTAGLGGVVVGGGSVGHLDDVHAHGCYLRRSWSLQARWLEENALRLPFHICLWREAGR